MIKLLKHKYFLFACIYLFGIKLYSANYQFQSYSVQQGLNHTHVLSMYQDNRGFLWIGTYGGLHQFNGYSFKLFTTNGAYEKSLSNNSVNVIFEDKKGNLWFGTENGLNKYNTKTGNFTKYYSTEGQLSNGSVKTIYEDDDNNIWVGTYGGGLNKLNVLSGTFEHFNSSSLGLQNNGFNKINDFFAKSNNEFWIGTEDGGLYIFNCKTNTISSQFKTLENDKNNTSIISTIKKTKNNNIWIGTWNHGLYKYDSINNSFEKHNYFTKGANKSDIINVKDIVEDRQGNLWLAHFGNGITKLNPKQKSFERFIYNKEDQFSINNNMIWNLLLDNTGILWIGTFGGGVNKLKLDHYKIPLIEIPSGLSKENANTGVSSVIQDRHGVLWIGTFGSGLYQYNIHKNEFMPYKIFSKGIIRAIMSMHEDTDGRIWVGTDLGLYRIDSTRKELKIYKNQPHNPNSIINEPIYKIYQDSRKNIWIGTWNGGLQLLSSEELKKNNPNNESFINFKHIQDDPSTIAHNIVYDIFEDCDGQIWVGNSEYLDKYNPENQNFTRVLQTVVSSIHQDKEGIIWVSSLSNGLFALNKQGEILKHYETLHELNNENFATNKSTVITGMTELNNNELWLTNNYGLTSFNKKTETFSNFSLKHDLFQNSLSLNTIITLKNGKIITGGIDGFNIINPDKLKYNTPLPEVVFTDFKVFNHSIIQGQTPDSLARINKPANELKQLNLSYKDKMIIIEYAAIEFFAPDQILYAYKLVGFDKDWVNDINNSRYASYSNLNPGTYTFMVKATNSKGHWNNMATSIQINIKPPFWKTLWFQLLIVLTIVFIVLIIIQLRTRLLYQQKKILQNLVDEQTSEIVKHNLELAKTNKELNAQKEEILEKTEEAKIANERKLRFFTSMSHEFRTPLTLILGPLDNLKERLKSDNISGYNLSVIQKNALRLLRLINDILDLRKFDTKNMKIICNNKDIVAFAKNIIDAFTASAKAKGINFTFYSNINSHITWFDAGKLEIILYNLISNALRFTNKNDSIKVTFNIDNDINIIIEDTGIGINPKKLNKIFDRFYQAELNNLNEIKGTGIGLSLTKEIIETLKGSIEVSSEIRKGTKFTITIPKLYPDNFRNNPDFIFNSDSDHGEEYNFLNKLVNEVDDIDFKIISESTNNIEKEESILLVEDDIDLRNFVTSCLVDFYKVYSAADGKKALKLAQEKQPSLIISDIMMPIMDGIEFCSKVKNDISTSHIPVILLSAKTSMELQLEGFETGADAFIPKPFNKTYLLTRVKAIISSRQKLTKVFQKQSTIEPKEITVTSIDESFLESAKNVVEQNMENSEFGVSDLVDKLAISRTLLHMKLKKLTNCSTSEFIRLMRLKRACQLLEHKKHRVSDICYIVGFNDPHSFSKIFKKQFGKTPTQYAETHKQ